MLCFYCDCIIVEFIFDPSVNLNLYDLCLSLVCLYIFLYVSCFLWILNVVSMRLGISQGGLNFCSFCGWYGKFSDWQSCIVRSMVVRFFLIFRCLTNMCMGVSLEKIKFLSSLAVCRSRFSSIVRILDSLIKLVMGVVR